MRKTQFARIATVRVGTMDGTVCSVHVPASLRRFNSAWIASRMNCARPYVPTMASICATSSGGNLTGTIFMLSGGRPMRLGLAGACAVFKKTMPFYVDVLNDTDYINGIEYERKAKGDIMANRFAVAWTKGSSDAFGWNGYLVDNQTGKRHRLVNEVAFEEFQGVTTWMRCAYDTKAELTAAARKLAQRLLK